MFEKKEEYIKVFLKVFKKYGFKSVSVDDLALHAGISKNILYKYFNNRENIVQSVMDLYVKEFNCIIYENFDKDIDVVTNLINTVCHLIKNLSKVNPVFFYTLQKVHFNKADLLVSLQKEYMRIMEGLVNKGIDEGIFRKEIDIEYMLHSHMNHVSLPINDSTLNLINTSYNAKRFVYSVINNIRGYTTLTGHQLIGEKLRLIDDFFDNQ